MYIRDELKKLVRQNKSITSARIIQEKVHEFETRIEMGVHYKIPYPRPTNVIPGATGKDPDAVMPVYLHSYRSSNEAQCSRRKTSIPVYEE